MTVVTCRRCKKTAAAVMFRKQLTQPTGWSGVTITGYPINNLMLCPECAQAVRDFIEDGVPPSIDVGGLCHWVQNRDGCAERETHNAFHFDNPCPYEAIAAVLRGEPDPREAVPA